MRYCDKSAQCGESKTKEPLEEKADSEQPTKKAPAPKADISFDLSKIPVDLIEKRRAEDEKRKSAEMKSKPVANLELVNASDSDSDNEDSDTVKTKHNSGSVDNKEEPVKDDLNYNEALENLTKIQQESKKINDDESISPKKTGNFKATIFNSNFCPKIHSTVLSHLPDNNKNMT